MRCQIFGDKKTILKVYSNFQALDSNNEIVIVKVKNRLDTSLNDIMIFFKLKDCCLIC